MMDFAQTWGILFSHPNSPPTIFGWAINSSLYRDPAFYLPIECYTGTSVQIPELIKSAGQLASTTIEHYCPVPLQCANGLEHM